MGFAPTWLRQVSPPPASQNHFNYCVYCVTLSVVCILSVCLSVVLANKRVHKILSPEVNTRFTHGGKTNLEYIFVELRLDNPSTHHCTIKSRRQRARYYILLSVNK